MEFNQTNKNQGSVNNIGYTFDQLVAVVIHLSPNWDCQNADDYKAAKSAVKEALQDLVFYKE